MNIQLEKIPATAIAYVRQTGPYGPANARAMEHLKQWALENELLAGSAVLFGIPMDNPADTAPEDCRYDACISLPGASAQEASAAAGNRADDSIRYGLLSGGTYAILTIEHTAEAVARAWDGLIPALQGSGRQLDPMRPVMERYTGEMIRNHLCQLCIPVQQQ
ncbi:GyrI-like domain-containing protein [Paenibacillus sp. MMS20-IR301]|uniref:AraC family transcriptional regulator n=1 Tax=Paenibacillus sp. MMS20-IR301 TaxID=2895946 RepID=UPI0028E69093|nr:GyrI-like domain-containing protein [Paenibacillus sp. MMS20-IR301]WNS44869.1 GyrI-like domain-containing protein [Paenibacillus sp. MMS20-IR301]